MRKEATAVIWMFSLDFWIGIPQYKTLFHCSKASGFLLHFYFLLCGFYFGVTLFSPYKTGLMGPACLQPNGRVSWKFDNSCPLPFTKKKKKTTDAFGCVYSALVSSCGAGQALHHVRAGHYPGKRWLKQSRCLKVKSPAIMAKFNSSGSSGSLEMLCIRNGDFSYMHMTFRILGRGPLEGYGNSLLWLALTLFLITFLLSFISVLHQTGMRGRI